MANRVFRSKNPNGDLIFEVTSDGKKYIEALKFEGATGNLLSAGEIVKIDRQIVKTERLSIGTSNPVETNQLQIEDGSHKSLFIVEQEGDVGIGTNKPTQLLHLYGQDSDEVKLQINTGEYTVVSLGADADSPNSGSLTLYKDNEISACLNSEESFISSPLGIGTSPDMLFHAYANTEDDFVAEFTQKHTQGHGIRIEATATEDETLLEVSSNEGLSPILYCKANNKTGLGTDSPNSTLQINNKEGGNRSALTITIEGDRSVDFEYDKMDNAALRLRGGDEQERVYLSSEGASYLNGGALGIGTPTPDEFFHVRKKLAGYAAKFEHSGNGGVMLNNNDATKTSGISMRINNTPNCFIGLEGILGNNFVTDSLANSLVISANLSTPIHICNDATAAQGITLDKTGSVGVGLTTPNALDQVLHIHNVNPHSVGLHLSNAGEDPTDGALLYIDDDLNLILENQEEAALRIKAKGDFDIENLADEASDLNFSLRNLANDSNGEYSTAIHYYAGGRKRGLVGFEGMSAGRLLTGDKPGDMVLGTLQKTSINFITNGEKAGYVDGTQAWYQKNNSADWSVTSDVRLKDVGPNISYGLNEIKQITPFRYSFKEGNKKGMNSETNHIGVSAQQLHEIIPESVEEGSDGWLSLKREPIFWTLINAVKELSEENELLKARLDILENS